MSPHTLSLLVSLLYFTSGTFGYAPYFDSQNVPVEDDALFLTPFIEAGHIAEAQELAKVDPMMKHVESFAGFLTVNKSTNSNIYFWLFKSQRGNWKERPLVVWLHGGPGYTSLIGLFGEIGPFSISTPKLQRWRPDKYFSKHTENASETASALEAKTPNASGNSTKQDSYHRQKKILRRRKFSWNREYNVLFVDNPVGAGFSFADSESGYPSDLAAETKDLYEALAQLYKLFPALKNNKLILAGDSYGMKFALAVSVEIQNSRKVPVNKGEGSQNPVPIPAGILALSGWVDPTLSTRYSSYLRGIGLLDREQSRYYESLEETMRAEMKSDNYLEAYRIWRQEMRGILNETGLKTGLNFILDSEGGATWKEPMLRFLNRTDVRKAIHVGTHKINPNEAVRSRMAGDWMRSTRPLLERLLVAELCPIVFLAGQVDVINPYIFQSEVLAALKWPHAEEYRDAKRCRFQVGGRVAAYTRTAGTLTEVLVRNTGHMIPCFQPEWAYALLNTLVTNVTKFQCDG